MPEIEPDAPISGVCAWMSLAMKANPPMMPQREIERQEPRAAERLLDVVAEHPEEDHVAENVHQIGVQELVGEKGRDRRARPE